MEYVYVCSIALMLFPWEAQLSRSSTDGSFVFVNLPSEGQRWNFIDCFNQEHVEAQ